MKYTEEMILQSSSGYCMPFEESSDEGVKIIKNYGEQKDSDFNHGIDFDVHNYLLSALASGTVCALGTDKEFGLYQTIRYGKYEVTYSNLATVFVNFGQQVKAGQTVAMSSDKLHFEVKFNGDELDPIQFLTMLYGNIKASRQNVSSNELITFDMPIVSPYDADRKEIEQLMLRYLPSYMRDIQSGHYVVPSHTEQSLRNIFSVGAAKQYFYETIPSVSNPLGIGAKAIPMASKVQNLLISDFLNYMALHHQIYLSSCSDEVKKKLHEQAVASSGIIDPLADLDIDIQSFDIPRKVSVYPDRAGVRWWTKAWFNGSNEGEASVEIERQMAIKFINDQVEKDAWLEEYFPKQMEIYHNAIEQTKEQILSQVNM